MSKIFVADDYAGYSRTEFRGAYVR